MKRSQQSVPGALTGAIPTDDGYAPNSHKQGIQWKNEGGRNATTNQARRGAGQLAPKPKVHPPERAASLATAGGLARGGTVPTGNAQACLPVASPPANVTGAKVGQPNPDTGAAATRKPSRKGKGAAFYGEYCEY